MCVRKLFADVIGDESSSLISIGSHVFRWISMAVVDNVLDGCWLVVVSAEFAVVFT